jgi:hypothetical protein
MQALLFWSYWIMVLLVVAGLLKLLWSSRDWREQALAALVLVPMVLRLLLVK